MLYTDPDFFSSKSNVGTMASIFTVMKSPPAPPPVRWASSACMMKPIENIKYTTENFNKKEVQRLLSEDFTCKCSYKKKMNS